MTQAANPPAVGAPSTCPLEAFQWTPQPQVSAFLRPIIGEFLGRCPAAAELARRMQAETGTRFPDWIDHLALPASADLHRQVLAANYRPADAWDGAQAFRHDGGMFPAIVLDDGNATRIAIKVESVADFAAANGLSHLTAEGPLSAYRRLFVASDDAAALWAVERHGFDGFVRPVETDAARMNKLRHLEKFRTRLRAFPDDAGGFDHASGLIYAAIADVGVHVTCDLFFAAEREFWMRRNRAAQAQYARQQRLGLGWGNHDHHTYRSSRATFTRLVALWEKLGLHCRERFYAGREAGWGAQVMEQPVTGIITFNDVDLSPDELLEDFAHEPLHPRDRLGTVGLWCGLHGDSFLQAGMHHLEAQFDFDSLRQQLQAEAGVRTMKPFTDFPHLRQAFTEGERWDVRPERIERLLHAGLITADQAKQFREQGAIGSHLENLERNDGFKGFNQTGVSEIIAHTDPRRHVRA